MLAFVVAFIVCFDLYKRRKRSSNATLEDVLDQFKQWNSCITAKQDIIEFYGMLNDFYKNVWNTEFRLQLTKEEFDQLPLETLKELNNQALDTIIENIKNNKK